MQHPKCGVTRHVATLDALPPSTLQRVATPCTMVARTRATLLEHVLRTANSRIAVVVNDMARLNVDAMCVRGLMIGGTEHRKKGYE